MKHAALMFWLAVILIACVSVLAWLETALEIWPWCMVMRAIHKPSPPKAKPNGKQRIFRRASRRRISC